MNYFIFTLIVSQFMNCFTTIVSQQSWLDIYELFHLCLILTLVPKYAPTLIDGFCLKIGALLPNCAITTIMASYLWIVSFLPYINTLMATYALTLTYWWIVPWHFYINTFVPKYVPTLIDESCLKIDALLPNCALTPYN